MDAKNKFTIIFSCLALGIGLAGGWMIHSGTVRDGEMQTAAMEPRNIPAESSRSASVGEERVRKVIDKREFMERRRRRSEGQDDSIGGRKRHSMRDKMRQSRPQEDPAAVYKISVGNAPVTGASNAKITVIEISDYECPFCARGSETMNQILQKYSGVLRIAMKQNPLPAHKKARGAANAALAAGEQGKYWEMHTKLFEATAARTPLTIEKIEEISAELGLDVEAIKNAVETDKYGRQIDEDQKQASNLGIRGVPVFFINGRKVVGARKAENFEAVIEEELKRADAALASGAPSDADGLHEFLVKDGAEKPVLLPGQENFEAPPNPFMGTGPARHISIPATSPVIGPADAKITLVEFLDFQCGYCKKTSADIQRLLSEYPNDIRVIFRHRPLTSLHPQAREAALASMAAAKQGKFWEMEKKLFENGENLSEEQITALAGEIGLEKTAFQADWKSGEIAALVDADMADAEKLGIKGTPTLFINGRTLIGSRSYESMKQLIDDELVKLSKAADSKDSKD